MVQIDRFRNVLQALATDLHEAVAWSETAYRLRSGEDLALASRRRETGCQVRHRATRRERPARPARPLEPGGAHERRSRVDSRVNSERLSCVPGVEGIGGAQQRKSGVGDRPSSRQSQWTMSLYFAVAALILGAAALLALFFRLLSENARLRGALTLLRKDDDRLYHYATGLARRMSRLKRSPDEPEEAAPRLRCAFFHDHPPWPVTAATWNPSNQPSPFHCGECREANKPDRTDSHWAEYELDSGEREGLHPEPCSVCFPDAVHQGWKIT